MTDSIEKKEHEDERLIRIVEEMAPDKAFVLGFILDRKKSDLDAIMKEESKGVRAQLKEITGGALVSEEDILREAFAAETDKMRWDRLRQLFKLLVWNGKSRIVVGVVGAIRKREKDFMERKAKKPQPEAIPDPKTTQIRRTSALAIVNSILSTPKDNTGKK